MTQLELVLTQKKLLAQSHVNKLYLNKFYCCYDCATMEPGDVLVEENLSNRYMEKIVAADIRRLRDVLMPVVARELNAYHGLAFSDNFWRRVISSWFQRIMYNIAFKYLRLKYVLAKFRDEYVISAKILSKDQYQYCQEVIDFVLAEQSEKYDFQFWSQVLSLLAQENKVGEKLDLQRIHYGEETMDDRFGKFQSHPPKRSLYERTWRRLKRTYASIKGGKIADAADIWMARLSEVLVGQTEAFAYMYYPGFSSALFDRITARTKGRIQPLPMAVYDKSYKLETVHIEELDVAFRKKLKGALLSTCPDDMDELRDVLDVAMDNVPTCFIEQLPQIRQQYQPFLLPRIQYLITMHGDYMNTPFLLYQSEMHERFGCRTIGIQHGGGYQMIRYDKFFSDYDESDIFYVWGSKEAGFSEYLKATGGAEIRESAPYKILSYRGALPTANSRRILFAGNGIAPYALAGMAADPSQQIDAQMTFLNALDKRVFSNLEYRDFVYTYGWNETDILKRAYPDLCFDDSTGKINSFLQKLMGCEILVCDAMETVYMEAIALRKPFIIFMPKDAYLPWDSELPYFRLMEEQGLLHYSPESAASLLNSIYPDIRKWWLEPSRQEALERIRQRYWCDVDDTEEWWLNEMMRLVDMGKQGKT